MNVCEAAAVGLNLPETRFQSRDLTHKIGCIFTLYILQEKLCLKIYWLW